MFWGVGGLGVVRLLGRWEWRDCIEDSGQRCGNRISQIPVLQPRFRVLSISWGVPHPLNEFSAHDERSIKLDEK